MADPSTLLLSTTDCVWQPMDAGAKACEHVGEETISSCENEDDWSPTGLEGCVLSGAGTRLRAARLGPFFSLPGQWRSLMTYTLRGLLNDGDRVVGFIGTPTTEDGTRIGYPPLHVHHLHVRKAEAGHQQAGLPAVDRQHASHWFETHGDYTGGDDFGVGASSTSGYVTRLPAGHCYLVNSADELDLNAEVCRSGIELQTRRLSATLLLPRRGRSTTCASRRRAARTARRPSPST